MYEDCKRYYERKIKMKNRTKKEILEELDKIIDYPNCNICGLCPKILGRNDVIEEIRNLLKKDFTPSEEVLIFQNNLKSTILKEIKDKFFFVEIMNNNENYKNGYLQAINDVTDILDKL